jgi:hypothetical protein
MPTDADENATTTNLSKLLPISITDDLSEGLSGKELAARFGCDAGGLSKASNKDNFAEWSQNKDYQGIAWRREGEGRKCRYYPLES